MVHILVCPGIHNLQLTRDFLSSIEQFISLPRCPQQPLLVFPTQDSPAYSAKHILQFLRDFEAREGTVSQLAIIAFSAGVVGAIGAAWGWRWQGRTIAAFVALDGWGVPLYGDFPIYRLSHDYFTHGSSSLLGNGTRSFYADPEVSHLDLWRMPHRVWGWQVGDRLPRSRLTAAEFMSEILHRHGAMSDDLEPRSVESDK
ncbi:MAG TPA: hypothetical protein IGS17_20895 [Oscillatoriales cyanobacterium M59_W2019_021]|nr:MAG: hypothetical protein D6728_20840 [Cyanobacteria bacterium J055]HIK30888.1 hypothetical protein [Oscillatoriales cyanobacterium M4454_W2019_049]HIK53348.1 hypothetical protein [Oscillatoriales cyanobacterium M59_W2019_021]